MSDQLRKWLELTDEERSAIAALPAMRRRYPRRCPVCNQRPEEGMLATQKYCCARCRVAAWRLRHPEKAYKPRGKKRVTKLEKEVESFLKRDRKAQEAQESDQRLSKKLYRGFQKF